MPGLEKIKDRYLGALLGLAVGDALGTTLEFKSPGSFQPLTDMVGGGPFKLNPGEWTDDTSMALCLAESLIISEGFDAADQMQRYCRWWKEGHLSSNGSCFDIGITVSSALSEFLKTGNPVSGSTDPYSAGNGSLMRLAPIPMAYRANADNVWQYARRSSALTHGAEACLDACGFYAYLIARALDGADKEELLKASLVPDHVARSITDPSILEIANGRYKERNPPDIRGTGYVVDAVEAALWAFYHSSDFKSGALLAVNLGDDADTTGAIYGQLAGAYYGAQTIPKEWKSMLALSVTIECYALALFDLSGCMRL